MFAPTRIALALVATLAAVTLATSPAAAATPPSPAARSQSTPRAHPQPPHFVNFGADGRRIPLALKQPRLTRNLLRVATTAHPIVNRIFVSVESTTPSTADDDVTGLDDLAKIKGLISQINAYWTTESGGQETVVFGGYETRAVTKGDGACDQNYLYYSSPNVAFGGKFKTYHWQGTNDHLLILSRESCALGLGSIGGSGGIMVSGGGVESPLALPFALHEFGHNLGFDHAGTSICLSTTTFDGPLDEFSSDSSASCPWNQYDDDLDIMGYGRNNATPGVSSPQLIRRGFLTDYREVGSGTTTTTLAPLSANSGTRALKITDGISGEDYYVELRTKSGTDASSAEWDSPAECHSTGGFTACQSTIAPGTAEVRVLRMMPSLSYNTTAVVAAGRISGQPASVRSNHLAAGQSFAAYDGGFTLTVNSVSSSTGAAVTVSFPPSVATTSTLVLSRETQTFGGATHAVATAQVAKVNGRYPLGRFVFTRGEATIASVEPTNGVSKLTVPATTPAGSWPIAAHFEPATEYYLPSDAAPHTLAVAQATSKVSFTLGTTSVKRHVAKKVKVVVSVAGVGAPTGTIAVYSGTKKLKAYPLSASARGHLTITLPKFTKVHTLALVIKYGGTSNIIASHSITKHLRIY